MAFAPQLPGGDRTDGHGELGIGLRARPRHADDVASTVNLTRDYGHGAGVFDVNLHVPRGSVYGLVGPNGSGKSSLLSILAGIRHADRGSARITIDRSAVALCPDVPEFEPWLTVFEVVDLARSMAAPDKGRNAVIGALAITGLAGAAHLKVAHLSRGMTQRLGLAATLVGDPQLLILDEPTSALDPTGRAEILDLVESMRTRRTVIFSSHVLSDVQRVADIVGVLRNGRLLYEGSTRALIDARLTPRWSLRVAEGAERVVAALERTPWATHVETAGPQSILVDARSMEDGERGLPRLLASCDARLVSCEPVAANLEAAFLALTNQPPEARRDGMPRGPAL